MISKSYKFELLVRGKKFLGGDRVSIEDVFNKLDGKDFPMGETFTHTLWLVQLERKYQAERFSVGERITMKSPDGMIMRESRIGASFARICAR